MQQSAEPYSQKALESGNHCVLRNEASTSLSNGLKGFLSPFLIAFWTGEEPFKIDWVPFEGLRNAKIGNLNVATQLVFTLGGSLTLPRLDGQRVWLRQLKNRAGRAKPETDCIA